MTKNITLKLTDCPCSSGEQFNACCGQYILDKKLPATPEQLMRSRYTAYTIADIDYIFETMRDYALKEADRAESLKWAKTSKWLGLDVLNASDVTDTSTEGEVEFVAKFIQDNRNHNLKEHAKFKKYDGRWYYVGDVEDYNRLNNTVAIQPIRVNKVGRNDPCSCGSGKKYKKCCLN